MQAELQEWQRVGREGKREVMRVNNEEAVYAQVDMGNHMITS